MTDEIVFDGSSMDELVRDLRASADRVDEECKKAVLEVGEELKMAAKKIAGEHSTSIPPTIHAIPVPEGVAVRAGSASVPLAALYDLGNAKKGGRKSPTFWHPVFGQRLGGIAQKRYPFFVPARLLLRKQINTRMNDTWEHALEPLRRHDGG